MPGQEAAAAAAGEWRQLPRLGDEVTSALPRERSGRPLATRYYAPVERVSDTVDATGFWRYAHERQSIWRRRADDAPRPWTSDKVLFRYWFANVHRELDTGTRVARAAIIDRPDATLEQRAALLMLYRHLNNWQAWVECAAPAASYDEVFDRLRERWARGASIFPRTWTVAALPYPGEDRLDRVRYAWETWTDESVARLVAARTVLEAHEALRGVPLMGRFTGYQVALDAQYLLDFSDDEEVPTYSSESKKLHHWKTSGSREGERMAGATVRELRDGQGEMLAAAGLSWASVAWSEKPRLTMADVENTLCEWVKYVHAWSGDRHKLRLYEWGAP
jgi:hypothetical protein